jgi:perosamine synthetase
MVRPEKMIYPIRFARSWLNADAREETIFREKMASLLGQDNHMIPIGRARAGVYLAVKHTVANGRARVIMSPYTLPDMINMVKFAGGDPVFVDFLPKSTNVDVDHLQSLIDERTACVLLTHYHVNQPDTAEILNICRSRQARLFDDCAISLGAQLSGRPIGTVTDASIFSFSGFKIFNFFWGGMIAGSSSTLFDNMEAEVSRWPRLRMPQYFKQVIKVGRYGIATSSIAFPLLFPVRRKMIESGEDNDIFPLSRIETTTIDETITSRPSISAFAEWNYKFDTISDIIAHRRAIASVYDNYFKKICVSAETRDDKRMESGFVNYPIVVAPQKRGSVYREILRRGFHVGLSLYPNAHEMKNFADIPGRSSNVSSLVRSIITLPTHRRITIDYADRLAACVSEVVARMA